MKLAPKLLCFYLFFTFSSSQHNKNWLKIQNHTEEVYLNLKKQAFSLQNARRYCSDRNAIVLVLWNIPVLNFVNNFFNSTKRKYIIKFVYLK